MLAEIAAGLGSLNAAKDFLKALNGVQNAAAIQEIKFTLQGHILDAQQGLFAAQEAQATSARRIADLEQEIVRLEDWSAEKQDYVLADTGQGSLAYEYLEGVESGHPAHWICPQCYEDGKKSILKHEVLPVGRTQTLVCHRCGFDVVTRGVRNDPPKGKAAFRR